MATKKSVFLGDVTVNWINITTIDTNAEDGPKWSEGINATFEQFRYLIKTSLPELSQEEWQIILNTYAGSYFPAHGVPARIASDIMDDLGVISIDALDPELADLVKKMHGLSQPEQLAVLYFVQIFWSGNVPAGETWGDTVSAIKAVM